MILQVRSFLRQTHVIRSIALGLAFYLISGVIALLQAAIFELGLRYDRHHSGHGLEIHRAADTYVVFFYTYQEDGSPDWFLCLGDMINGVLQGDCSHFQYLDGNIPPLQVDMLANGAFTLDFVAAGDASACNDGKARSNAEQLAVFGWSARGEYQEWCTEFLRIGQDYPQPYYGGIWYGGDTDGYGCSLSHMDNTLSAICYYFDANGQPRWALGAGPIDVGTIRMTHFQGYCRQCPVADLIGTDIGSLVLDLDPGSAPGSGSDTARLSLQFAVGPAGSFEREFPLLPLTDGSQTGAHHIPLLPIQTEAQVAAWRSDLNLFAEQLRSIHPNPFHGVSEEEFDGAMASLANRLPYLNDDQFAAEVMKVVALISREGRDSHTVAYRPDSTALPLQFYLFSNGVYIVDALPPYQALIGGEVTQIGNTNIQAVLDRLDVAVPRDNEISARYFMGTALLLTDLYSGLGLIDDRSSVPITVENVSGEQIDSTIEPISLLDYNQWKAFGNNTLPSRSTLYLSNTEQAFWFAMLEESGTLYVQYNHVFAIDEAGQTIALFAQRLANVLNNVNVQRMVIDLRHNDDGGRTTYGPLLELLSGDERINSPDFLYVIAGRQTTSAALTFATDVENLTQALFVGEGTGGSPTLYADPVGIQLPNSGIQLNISSLIHLSPVANDQRLSMLPDIAVDLSSKQYYGDIDPAMDAILTVES